MSTETIETSPYLLEINGFPDAQNSLILCGNLATSLMLGLKGITKAVHCLYKEISLS